MKKIEKSQKPPKNHKKIKKSYKKSRDFFISYTFFRVTCPSNSHMRKRLTAVLPPIGNVMPNLTSSPSLHASDKSGKHTDCIFFKLMTGSLLKETI